MHDMRLVDIKPIDVLNGYGTRTSIWFSGCSHQCEGCFAKNTWAWTGPTSTEFQLYDKIYEYMTDDRIVRDGISLLGGDPLYYKNRPELYAFLDWFKKTFPTKTVWLWTGYVYEDCRDMPEVAQILEYVDVLVDGRFEKDLADPSLHFRGSSNQRIICLERGFAKSIWPKD